MNLTHFHLLGKYCNGTESSLQVELNLLGADFSIYLAFILCIVIFFFIVDYSGISEKLLIAVSDCAADPIVNNDERKSCLSMFDKTVLRYDGTFYREIEDMRCYFPVKSTFFLSTELDLHLIRLPLGFLENLLMYLCNHSILLGMAFSVKGGAFSRISRRFSFVAQSSVAFMLSSFLYFTKVKLLVLVMAILFVMVPCTLVVNRLFYYFTACPCTGLHSRYRSVLRCLGALVCYPLAVLSLVLLVVPTALSVKCDRNALGYITKYAMLVQAIAIAVDLLTTGALFYGETSLILRCCQREFVLLGKWNLERLQSLSMETTDYAPCGNCQCLALILRRGAGTSLQSPAFKPTDTCPSLATCVSDVTPSETV